MIATLRLVQQALQSALPYMRPGDIYLTGDLTILPADVMLPCIGIKDGPVRSEELAGGMMRHTLTVQLMVWVRVVHEPEALIGAAGRKGVLDIEADIDQALDEHDLGDGAIISATRVSPAAESLALTDGNVDYQRKPINYQYVKECLRPSAARG